MRRVLLPALVATLTCVASPALADEVLKGPYLLHMSGTSVDVRVELAHASELSVTVAPEAGSDGGSQGETVTSAKADMHTVHLSGLAPGRRYHYAVRVAGGAAHEGTFTTAPDGASHAPFSFVAYGDNRTDGPTHERVVQAIAKESFDFLVNTGDAVNAGADEASWQSFFDIEEPILKGHPLFECLGNHELASDRAAAHFERYFGPIEPPGAGADNPLYGSFRWGRTRVFLLNAFDDWGGKERAWLDVALTHADAEPGVDLRIAVLHHGPYSAGLHGNNRALLAAGIDALLVAHHVDLVVSGHDHIYERGDAKGLKYIVTGGGGAPLYPEIHPLPSTRKAEATYHYVLVTVTDADVAIVAKRPDGSVVDRCSFVRGSSWSCDPPPAPAVSAMPEAPAIVPPTTRWGCTTSTPPASGDGGAALGLLGVAGVAVRRRRERRV